MVYDPVPTLDKLAAELSARGYQTRLVIEDQTWLAVRNPSAPDLSERVTVGPEWFWWPWGEPIVPATDIHAAAENVARVLRTVDA